ncbi:MAG: HAD hydrolase-like protein [Candidatus Nomurabacteria bacterium]|nr:HAD hydrolase-like protein [Candidatus Nomurabacteria bacterium]
MQNKKIIIWDFDGVIVDSREMALELTQYQFENVTEDLHRDLFNGNIFVEIAKLQKKERTTEEFDTFVQTNYWPRKMNLIPVPGIREVLEALSNDFIMVINSSSAGKNILDYLEKNGFSHYFQKIYGKEIASKEEKFHLILKEFKVFPNDCLLITDTVGDVLEAKSLNISSVVVLWGYQLRRHFDFLEKEVIFAEQPVELVEIIRNYFKI